jgi:hypothetical protein
MAISKGLAVRAQKQVPAASRHALDHTVALATAVSVSAKYIESPLAE